jgi:Fe-S-cluster containining protein
MCGDCCRGYGGTYLSETDVTAIAAHLGQDPRYFVTHACRTSGGRPVLAQGKNGYCLFWERLCTIHPVKPRMCRAWPFIEAVLVDVRNWHAMATCCPGMRTDVADEVILARVRHKLSEGSF